MRDLIIVRVHETEAPSAAARNIVTEEDALEAILYLAMTLDEAMNEGELSPGRLENAAAHLMVVREFIRPLPDVDEPELGQVPVGLDLNTLVQALRQARRGS